MNVNSDTGICRQCSDKAVMVGFVCVAKEVEKKNCYWAQDGENVICAYCKMGYTGYYGNCMPLKEIIEQNIGLEDKCKEIDYLQENQGKCLSSLDKNNSKRTY